MKSTFSFVRSLARSVVGGFVRNMACTALCLGLASAGFAASKKPLSQPNGLAVDAKGNLYVANFGGNYILVYNPNYVQVPKDTITEGIGNPTGVAFDPQGNLWVANYGDSNGSSTGSVSEYTAGKQNANGTITSGMMGPQAIAIDGLGNVWVETDSATVAVYGPAFVYSPPTTLIRSISTSEGLHGIVLVGGTFALGSDAGTSLAAATLALTIGDYSEYAYNDISISMAADAAGRIYMGGFNGVVNIAYPAGYEGGFAALPFVPTGMAIDNVRGRIYISSSKGNFISVYSTTNGALLTTIK